MVSAIRVPIEPGKSVHCGSQGPRRRELRRRAQPRDGQSSPAERVLLATPDPAFRDAGRQDETNTDRRSQDDLPCAWRKDKNEAAVLHQRRETGHAERRHEEPRGGPRVQSHRDPCLPRSRPRVQDQRDTDNQGQPQRGEPQTKAGIEVPDQHHQVPQEVAPQDQARSREVRQIVTYPPSTGIRRRRHLITMVSFVHAPEDLPRHLFRRCFDDEDSPRRMGLGLVAGAVENVGRTDRGVLDAVGVRGGHG